MVGLVHAWVKPFSFEYSGTKQAANLGIMALRDGWMWIRGGPIGILPWIAHDGLRLVEQIIPSDSLKAIVRTSRDFVLFPNWWDASVPTNFRFVQGFIHIFTRGILFVTGNPLFVPVIVHDISRFALYQIERVEERAVATAVSLDTAQVGSRAVRFNLDTVKKQTTNLVITFPDNTDVVTMNLTKDPYKKTWLQWVGDGLKWTAGVTIGVLSIAYGLLSVVIWLNVAFSPTPQLPIREPAAIIQQIQTNPETASPSETSAPVDTATAQLPTETATTTQQDQYEESIQQDWIDSQSAKNPLVAFMSKGIYRWSVNQRVLLANLEGESFWLRIVGVANPTDEQKKAVFENPIVSFLILGMDSHLNSIGDEDPNIPITSTKNDQNIIVFLNTQTGEFSFIALSRKFFMADGSQINDAMGKLLPKDPAGITFQQNILFPIVSDGNQNDPMVNARLRFEWLTGRPIDSVTAFGFNGFRDAINALYPNGITITSIATITDALDDKLATRTIFESGVEYTMDGATLLDYVRLRHGEGFLGDSTGGRTVRLAQVIGEISKDLAKRVENDNGFESLLVELQHILAIIQQGKSFETDTPWVGSNGELDQGLLFDLIRRDQIARDFAGEQHKTLTDYFLYYLVQNLHAITLIPQESSLGIIKLPFLSAYNILLGPGYLPTWNNKESFGEWTYKQLDVDAVRNYYKPFQDIITNEIYKEDAQAAFKVQPIPAQSNLMSGQVKKSINTWKAKAAIIARHNADYQKELTFKREGVTSFDERRYDAEFDEYFKGPDARRSLVREAIMYWWKALWQLDTSLKQSVQYLFSQNFSPEVKRISNTAQNVEQPVVTAPAKVQPIPTQQSITQAIRQVRQRIDPRFALQAVRAGKALHRAYDPIVIPAQQVVRNVTSSIQNRACGSAMLIEKVYAQNGNSSSISSCARGNTVGAVGEVIANGVQAPIVSLLDGIVGTSSIDEAKITVPISFIETGEPFYRAIETILLEQPEVMLLAGDSGVPHLDSVHVIAKLVGIPAQKMPKILELPTTMSDGSAGPNTIAYKGLTPEIIAKAKKDVEKRFISEPTNASFLLLQRLLDGEVTLGLREALFAFYFPDLFTQMKSAKSITFFSEVYITGGSIRAYNSFFSQMGIVEKTKQYVTFAGSKPDDDAIRAFALNPKTFSLTPIFYDLSDGTPAYGVPNHSYDAAFYFDTLYDGTPEEKRLAKEAFFRIVSDYHYGLLARSENISNISTEEFRQLLIKEIHKLEAQQIAIPIIAIDEPQEVVVESSSQEQIQSSTQQVMDSVEVVAEVTDPDKDSCTNCLKFARDLRVFLDKALKGDKEALLDAKNLVDQHNNAKNRIVSSRSTLFAPNKFSTS